LSTARQGDGLSRVLQGREKQSQPSGTQAKAYRTTIDLEHLRFRKSETPTHLAKGGKLLDRGPLKDAREKLVMESSSENP